MFLYKSFEFIFYKYKPVKNMYISCKRISGRSSKGTIVLYHRGGGLKKNYRILDFIRFLRYLPLKILRIEYDRLRLNFIALVLYINGCLSYILAPNLIDLNDFIFSTLKYFMVLGSVFFF